MIEMDGHHILDVTEQSINGNCRLRYIFTFICDHRLDHGVSKYCPQTRPAA